MFEQKDNTGHLFRNDKRSSDKHPNARGTAKINGTEYLIAAWTKSDKHGQKYQSLVFKEKEISQPEQNFDIDITF